jgi:hypothetical protein
MNERRVERVARAMCWTLGRDPDEVVWGGVIRWRGMERLAQTAVDALSSCLTPEYDSARDLKREDAFVELD